MAKVEVEFEETDLVNEEGKEVPGLTARCSLCDHEVECFGRTDASRRRCFVFLREGCNDPDEGKHFYVDAAGE
jgi:hypothetical protein